MTNFTRLGLGSLVASGLLLCLTGLGKVVDVPKWSPLRGATVVGSERTWAFVRLIWDETKTIPNFAERDTRFEVTKALEVELILPKAVRRFPNDPANKLKFIRSKELPDRCQHRDVYVGDKCEQWSLLLLTAQECLPSALEKNRTINIAMSSSSPIPNEVSAGQLQISRVGKNWETYGKTKLGGLICTGLCAACGNFTMPVLSPLLEAQCQLERLRHLCVSEVIGTEEFTIDRERIRAEQRALAEELANPNIVGELIEPYLSALSDVNQLKTLFHNGTTDERHSLIRRVSSNLILKSKIATIQAKKPYLFFMKMNNNPSLCPR